MRPAVLLAAIACFGETGTGLPKIGCLLDSEGQSLTVWGVRGAFVVGGSDCTVDRRDDGWSVRRENGRLWRVRVDPDSGGETARAALPAGVTQALVLDDTATLEAYGAELRIGDWRHELPSAVTELRWMAGDWIQAVTAEGSWAIHRSREIYMLPGGVR